MGENGKGSKQRERQVSYKKYSNNYDKIFKKNKVKIKMNVKRKIDRIRYCAVLERQGCPQDI